MKKILLTKLNELYAFISKDKQLFLPIENSDVVNFGLWTEGVNVRYDKMTVKSAKDCFFPQYENLMQFKKEDKTIVVEPDEPNTQAFVAMGVRACDVRSFDILDRVFMVNPLDTFYKGRRENGIIISLCCNKPEETCFCQTFGIDPASPKGDIETYIDAEYMYWNAVTEKGMALTKELDSLLEDSDNTQVDAIKTNTKAIMAKLPFANLTTDGFGGDKLKELWDRPEWDKMGEICLACGTCTYVCPTCQCYDIRDYKTNKGVQRFRCWDSCMKSDFTLMAHGNNRNTQAQRVRQRFMHKLVYYPANNDGIYSCVGCGRCVAKCPVSLNIVKVIKSMGGK